MHSFYTYITPLLFRYGTNLGPRMDFVDMWLGFYAFRDLVIDPFVLRPDALASPLPRMPSVP